LSNRFRILVNFPSTVSYLEKNTNISTIYHYPNIKTWVIWLVLIIVELGLSLVQEFQFMKTHIILPSLDPRSNKKT
jgi:hypothetical protein